MLLDQVIFAIEETEKAEKKIRLAMNLWKKNYLKTNPPTRWEHAAYEQYGCAYGIELKRVELKHLTALRAKIAT